MILSEEICTAYRNGERMDALLTRFVVKTASRASGCWRLEKSFLNLIGFGCVDDMPDEVSVGFQNATRRVALDQTGLGIVKAAITAKPVIGRRDAQSTGLDGSASWISRFAANTSLAVPIFHLKSQAVVGVLAVSTAEIIQEGDALWMTLTQLADQIARCDDQAKS